MAGGVALNCVANGKILKKNVFDNFDKILYINLKHREDRKKQIESELLRIGIPKNK